MSFFSQYLMGVGVPAQVANFLDDVTVKYSPKKSVSVGLTAAGTTIADALALVSLTNVVATAAASTGVKLPDAPIGQEVKVQNNGASILNLFPVSALGTINGGSAGAAVTIAVGAGVVCTRLSTLDWLVTVTAKES